MGVVPDRSKKFHITDESGQLCPTIGEYLERCWAGSNVSQKMLVAKHGHSRLAVKKDPGVRNEHAGAGKRKIMRPRLGDLEHLHSLWAGHLSA